VRGARIAVVAAAAAALVLPAQASAKSLEISGRGFGHGIGLSQWGAYGYALKEGRSYDWILGHYYPGTRLERVKSRTVRVLLRSSRTQTIAGASAARGGGRSVRLHDDRSYRVQRSGSTLRLYDTRARRTKARLRAPVRFSGGSTVRLLGTAENGVRSGFYRGDILLVPAGSRLLAINRVPVERYLYGVVPAEMPASWPAAALGAQAVAARTYVLRGLTPGDPFDAFADTRSQVYRGVSAETSHTTRAVRATRGRVLTYDGEIAHTYFFSTSGGRTAAIEDEWNAAPIPYLRSVDDPYDYLSPVHTWRVRMSLSHADRALGGLVRG
jgi:stage II sporulation protein D